MSDTDRMNEPATWSNGFHCTRIFSTFRIARQPAKILLIVFALLLTVAWGDVLDLIWVKAGKGIQAAELAVPAWDSVSAPGDAPKMGIFKAYSSYCRGQVAQLARFVMPVDAQYARIGTLAGPAFSILYATKQMIVAHPLYSILFWPVILLIWSLFGGTVCRMASVEVARGETIPLREAICFARRHLWAGFFLAPAVPVVFILIFGGLLALFGLFHSIPVLGDVLGGLFFFLALGGGFVGVLLLVGLLGGGHLLWPVVATEGTTSFDAFSTSFHYLYTRPWRVGLYAFIALVYGLICWLVVNFFAHLTLWFTRLFVGFGSVASRGEEVSKLDIVWSYPALFGAMHSWQPELVSSWDKVSAWAIAMWIVLVNAITWAFLLSIYFSASTTIYFLLRRAIDLTEYNEIEELTLAPVPAENGTIPENTSEPHSPDQPEKEETQS